GDDWEDRLPLVRGDDGENLVRVPLELRRPDARDAGKVGPIPGLALGDLCKGPVAEHHVGGYAIGLGALATPLPEPVEERPSPAHGHGSSASSPSSARRSQLEFVEE